MLLQLWLLHQFAKFNRLLSSLYPTLHVTPCCSGKTEIARRLAKLADAPFIKVEATKFTEVRCHGHKYR